LASPTHLVALGALLVAALVGAGRESSADSARPITRQVDVTWDGGRPEGGGVESSLSSNGRFVAFSSSANDLTPDDTQQGAMGRDVFVRDRAKRATTRVSVSSGEDQGNGESDQPSISADGRLVAFSSYASNLAANDTNGNSDVFVRDRRRGTTTLVSVASDGAQANSYSADPAISGDGRFVAFASLASNLAQVTGLRSRIYVHDRRTHTTALVSSVLDDAGEPVISADGRVVVFTRLRGRRSSVYAYDRDTSRTTRIDVSSRDRPAERPSFSPAVSRTGRYVAFASHDRNLVAGDRNGGADIFVRDRLRGTTHRVSIRPSGRAVRRCPPSPEPDNLPPPICAGEPAISGDGRDVVFSTEVEGFDRAGRPGGVFMRDRRRGRTVRISTTRGGRATGADLPSISANGRFATFRASAIFIRGPLR
jgi:Tol biopolymer transport system component